MAGSAGEACVEVARSGEARRLAVGVVVVGGREEVVSVTRREMGV